jgi:hypothetical protein
LTGKGISHARNGEAYPVPEKHTADSVGVTPFQLRWAPKGHRGNTRSIPDKWDEKIEVPPPGVCECGREIIHPEAAGPAVEIGGNLAAHLAMLRLLSRGFDFRSVRPGETGI